MNAFCEYESIERGEKALVADCLLSVNTKNITIDSNENTKKLIVLAPAFTHMPRFISNNSLTRSQKSPMI